MSSSDKKSFIPRPTQDCDRIPKTKVVKSAVKKAMLTPRQDPDQGVVRGDSDPVQTSLVRLEADHARMKETLEEGLRDAEERLEAMKMLMEERERRHAARMQEASQQTESLEREVGNLEKQLTEHNIDPVTSQIVEASSEGTEAVEKQCKVTKDDVKRMRCRLKEMNDKSDRFLLDIQHILQELTDLQEASSRAGGSPVIDRPVEDLVLRTGDAAQTVEAISSGKHDDEPSTASAAIASPSLETAPAETVPHAVETAQETQLVPFSGVFFTET